MIIIATGFIALLTLSIISMMVIWESSQWLGQNIMQSTVKKERLESIDRCPNNRNITEMMLKAALTLSQMTNFGLFQSERVCR